MAKLSATSAINYSRLDISGLMQATDSGFDDNVNAVVHGVTYQDVVWFEDESSATNFGGTGFVVTGAGVVTGGKVTGVQSLSGSGVNMFEDWRLEGLNVSAVSIYNAALTIDRTDDLALVSAALAGADTFQLSNFADKMRGFGGNDRLFGNGGADVLSGDGGNDTLTGGLGRDTLTGNAGADVFDYNRTTESGLNARDVITDFRRGLDHIDLSGIDANSVAGGNQDFTGFIKAGAAFTRAGQLKFVDGVLFGNTDGDATAEFAIVLTGVTALSVADLVL